MADRFPGDELLLSSETPRALFHGAAERAPNVGLHNHLPAADIADDRVYADLDWLSTTVRKIRVDNAVLTFGLSTPSAG